MKELLWKVAKDLAFGTPSPIYTQVYIYYISLINSLSFSNACGTYFIFTCTYGIVCFPIHVHLELCDISAINSVFNYFLYGRVGLLIDSFYWEVRFYEYILHFIYVDKIADGKNAAIADDFYHRYKV